MPKNKIPPAVDIAGGYFSVIIYVALRYFALRYFALRYFA